MMNTVLKKLTRKVAPKSQVGAIAPVLWGGYNQEYLNYEKTFPFGFPWSREEQHDEARFVKGADGYWINGDANQNQKAVLTCTGDLMCEPGQHREYKYGGEYFFHPEFKYVRDILRESDFTVGNLETTVTDITPYAGEWHRIAGKFHCNAPESYLRALRYAGFDALVNANNHNCDSAVTGLMDTLDALDRNDFMHTGTFRPDSQERVLLVNVNGIKIAIMSYATYFNKLDTNFTKRGQDLLLNRYSRKKAAADLAYAKQHGAEFVLVYMHWGKEYTHELTEWQQAKAAELAEIGFDYVVGSHSHSLQPKTTISTSDGRQVPVIYSLGNFVTSDNHQISKYTAILKLVLERTDEGVKIANDYIVPCYVAGKIGNSAYAPVPADVLLNGGCRDKVIAHSDDYVGEVFGDGIKKFHTASMDLHSVCNLLGVSIPDGMENQSFTRIVTKPESVTDGCLYISIIWKSEENLKKVAEKAAAIVTSRPVEGLPCIVVEDDNAAYCKIFSAIRDRFAAKVIAVTGSVGKTTTKEIIEDIIQDSYLMHSSPGNWNTRHTGMLIMQKLRPYHEYYIQEIHEGDPHSAEMMSTVLKPDIAIITNIDSAHQENFKTYDDFVQSFIDITVGIPAGGLLLVNSDDTALMTAVNHLPDKAYQVKTFALEDEQADYKVTNLHNDGENLHLDIAYNAKTEHIVCPSPILKNAYNIAAAFAVGIESGIEAETVSQSISQYQSSGIRQNVMEFKGLKMMLDCRSASPLSMRSAIDSFCQIPCATGHRRHIVLGDMHLRSEESEREHRAIGRLIAESDADCCYCYGPESYYIFEEALRNGFKQITHFKTKESLEIVLAGNLHPGDTLLIKGGRRMYLNSTIRHLFGITISID